LREGGGVVSSFFKACATIFIFNGNNYPFANLIQRRFLRSTHTWVPRFEYLSLRFSQETMEKIFKNFFKEVLTIQILCAMIKKIRSKYKLLEEQIC